MFAVAVDLGRRTAGHGIAKDLHTAAALPHGLHLGQCHTDAAAGGATQMDHLGHIGEFQPAHGHHNIHHHTYLLGGAGECGEYQVYRVSPLAFLIMLSPFLCSSLASLIIPARATSPIMTSMAWIRRDWICRTLASQAMHIASAPCRSTCPCRQLLPSYLCLCFSGKILEGLTIR